LKYSAVLLDIEGTTTPVSYVFEILFPFAHKNASAFLRANATNPDVLADLALLKAEYSQDQASAVHGLPHWSGTQPEDAVPYIQFLIDIDRKSTGLKALQGKIWQQGYAAGALKSQLFPDIHPAFAHWQAAGISIYIFSSGSIQAQQLIFRYSPQGDLTPYISGYFDTTTGPKRESSSYLSIAQQIGQAPTEILFVSDVVAELRPAHEVGFQVRFSHRPGNHTDNPEEFSLIHTFDDLLIGR
jgi:enolase-phosphatase E1